jgi:hypothetical protein
MPPVLGGLQYTALCVAIEHDIGIEYDIKVEHLHSGPNYSFYYLMRNSLLPLPKLLKDSLNHSSRAGYQDPSVDPWMLFP